MGRWSLEDSPRVSRYVVWHKLGERRADGFIGTEVHTTTVRMQNREAVIAELEKVKPTHVLNAAGSTGRPNVDWCEDHKEDTVRNNVVGTLNLTDCCFLKGIHITVFATGCIYAYDDVHPIGGPGFLETDKANFNGSFYSETKAHVEEVSRVLAAHSFCANYF
jgi:3,5-epimerase/4-reductase